jgi:hypothetical protein
VDLVDSGILHLLTTQDEERAARADFAAAASVGLDLSNVRWISNQKLIEVC